MFSINFNYWNWYNTNYQSLKNNLFLILVQLNICCYIRMNAQMQTLSSQAIRIKQWLGEMHRLVVFYYCQRFYQVAIERNKILRYENLDKFITVNRYALVSGRISNKF